MFIFVFVMKRVCYLSQSVRLFLSPAAKCKIYRKSSSDLRFYGGRSCRPKLTIQKNGSKFWCFFGSETQKAPNPQKARVSNETRH